MRSNELANWRAVREIRAMRGDGLARGPGQSEKVDTADPPCTLDQNAGPASCALPAPLGPTEQRTYPLLLKRHAKFMQMAEHRMSAHPNE